MTDGLLDLPLPDLLARARQIRGLANYTRGAACASDSVPARNGGFLQADLIDD